MDVGGVVVVERYYFYGVNGKVMAELEAKYDPGLPQTTPGLALTAVASYRYVGVRRVGFDEPLEDRLGTRGAGASYYPYGDGAAHFATYEKDGAGLHYADQRYYHSGYGRFLTADPYVASGGAGAPGSWNRYAYVEGDPVNHHDPGGLCAALPGTLVCISETVEEKLSGGTLPGGRTAIGGREGADVFVPEMPPGEGVSSGGGGGGGPANRGGWNTDPREAAKVGWQYLTSIWEDCLKFFSRDQRFEQGSFRRLLQGGMNWFDTRDSAVGSRTVASVVGNGDQTTLRQAVGAANAVVLGDFTPNVALGVNYFTDITQTQQIAVTVHEALHVHLRMNDVDLKGWLTNFEFKPQGGGSGDITDWIADGCK